MLIVDAEGEILEACAEGLARVVAQAGDLSAAAVVQRQRFEDVVHLRRFEIEPRRLAGGQRAGAFEESDPVLVEHHFADGQIGGERTRSRQAEQQLGHTVEIVDVGRLCRFRPFGRKDPILLVVLWLSVAGEFFRTAFLPVV